MISGRPHASGLCDRRRRLGRVRAGQPADRGPVGAGHPDRGRRARLEPADPCPGRLYETARPSDPDLGLQGRTRSRHRRAGDPVSARPGARRLVVDQRADLYPRPARGFRPLGAARQSRLGLGRRPALFQAGRALAGRAQRAARHHRLSDDLADGRAAGRLPGDHRGGAGTRPRIPRGRQPSAARRRPEHRLVPADPRRKAPRQRRADLSEAGREARQSADRDERAGPPPDLQRQPRDRHRPVARRPGRDRRCGARGHPRRRRDRLAASAAALGHRAARGSGEGRHPGAPRAAGGRLQFPGPLHRAHVGRGARRRDLERARPRPAVRPRVVALCAEGRRAC